MASTSAALRRRRRAERMFKRAVRRIRRFFASYVSPLGWAVTGAGIACLIAFPFLGWYELLVFGIVAMVAMTPLLTIQTLGLLYRFKQKDMPQETLAADDEDSIIVLEGDT